MKNNLPIAYKKVSLLFFVALVPSLCMAHTINYALESAPSGQVVWYYLQQGIQHIIPYGLDHILFVVALCLLNQKIKIILWQATAFTIAHTITLALSMKNIVVLPSEVVEPIIALSIVFIAAENLIFRDLRPWRLLLVFSFGLIHGLGFAAALNEIGLPPNKFTLSLLSFNLGVELGQVIVILLVYFLLIMQFRKYTTYRKRIVYPISFLIGAVAMVWAVQRIVL